MEAIKIDLNIYSPRWGHDDRYTVNLQKDSMIISQAARSAKCEWQENQDPKWSKEFNKNSLEAIMNNDSIYPPSILPSMFEQVWKSWRNGELDENEAKIELEALATWLNTITKAKPNTSFWSKYF